MNEAGRLERDEALPGFRWVVEKVDGEWIPVKIPREERNLLARLLALLPSLA